MQKPQKVTGTPVPVTLYDSALRDHKTGKSGEAIEKLSLLLRDHPKFEDAYEALSVVLYQQKKYDEAIGLLKKWLAVNPQAMMAYTNLSRCYVAKEMIAEAEQAQAEARKLSWKMDLKAKKRDIPSIDYEEQIQRFKKVIELDPTDVLGYFSLGTAYAVAGKKREAMDTFRKAVEVDPQHSSSYYGLGMALESLGDLKQACEIYQKGILAADAHGDIMTQRKMESRLRNLA